MTIRIPFASSDKFVAWLQKLRDFVESNGFDGANYKKNRVTWLSDEDDRCYTAITRHGIERSDEYFQNRCVAIRVDGQRIRFTLMFSDRHSTSNYSTPEDVYSFITTSLLSGEIQHVIGCRDSEIAQPMDLILESMPTHIADIVKDKLSNREESINRDFFGLTIYPSFESYKEFCKSGESQGWLVNRFLWSESREGHEFWENIQASLEGRTNSED